MVEATNIGEGDTKGIRQNVGRRSEENVTMCHPVTSFGLAPDLRAHAHTVHPSNNASSATSPPLSPSTQTAARRPQFKCKCKRKRKRTHNVNANASTSSVRLARMQSGSLPATGHSGGFGSRCVLRWFVRARSTAIPFPQSLLKKKPEKVMLTDSSLLKATTPRHGVKTMPVVHYLKTYTAIPRICLLRGIFPTPRHLDAISFPLLLDAAMLHIFSNSRRSRTWLAAYKPWRRSRPALLRALPQAHGPRLRCAALHVHPRTSPRWTSPSSAYNTLINEPVLLQFDVPVDDEFDGCGSLMDTKWPSLRVMENARAERLAKHNPLSTSPPANSASLPFNAELIPRHERRPRRYRRLGGMRIPCGEEVVEPIECKSRSSGHDARAMRPAQIPSSARRRGSSRYTPSSPSLFSATMQMQAQLLTIERTDTQPWSAENREKHQVGGGDDRQSIQRRGVWEDRMRGGDGEREWEEEGAIVAQDLDLTSMAMAQALAAEAMRCGVSPSGRTMLDSNGCSVRSQGFGRCGHRARAQEQREPQL
ncbi:hypothetical protein C8R43DRAFT_1118308 [Mycena crocata]|nr:hypothetical protein C8R43DRAFT_1118308 [Mycena crocata]